MRSRRIAALSLVIVGVVVEFVSAALLRAYFASFDWLFGVVVGVVLIFVGLALLVTEPLEAWLTKGQRALVDGLQAG